MHKLHSLLFMSVLGSLEATIGHRSTENLTYRSPSKILIGLLQGL